MSAHIEYALLSKVVETKDFHTLEKLQITNDFFTAPEMRQVHQLLRDTYHHPATAGLVLSQDMIQQYFPAFQVHWVPDEVPVLCQALRREKTRMELLNLAGRIQQEAESDPQAALGRLKVGSQTISALAEVGEDLSLAGGYAQLMERYHMMASAKGLIGIPFPWDVVNQETHGMQGSQFLVLYGRPKSMKTWVAIDMAVHAYKNARRRVLFYTREMPPIQILQRVAARYCGVSYRAFTAGTLDPVWFQYVNAVVQGIIQEEQNAAKHGHQPCFIITSDRDSGGGGVSWLRAKIREVQPDVVFVDGMYLMKDDRSNTRSIEWKNIAHISQDLKHSSQEFDIPIVGVTQASRKSDVTKPDEMHDIAYADALSQDADVVMRIKRVVKRDEHTGLKKTELIIYTPGFREGVLDGFVLEAEPASKFDFVRAIVDAEEQEEEEYGKSAKKEQQQPRPLGAQYKANPANFRDPTIGSIK